MMNKLNYPCFNCMSTLTDAEMKEWYKDAQYCCDGYMCGCRGEPVDPPLCDKCVRDINLGGQII